MIFVAYDQGSIDLGLDICSFGLAGGMQLTVRAKLPNLAFLAFFPPVGEQQAANVTASRTLMQGTRGDVKTRRSRLVLTRSPGKPTLVGHPRWPISPTLAF